ncbi:organic hydroperoxide reductase OsmC/OhrA [Hoeflea marina]|uniref:Organic hydroperoxide reductase OsmC/OhrA n=1 Tax=Hoeflea marina TaxID=274592 RepID=A0A317PS98_9HYPH|nr:OsmC family protein [Hoeflea marina]PWW01764.1 organic hydroperoxide reductase OsmC/OhrA [Hoeflea marina]
MQTIVELRNVRGTRAAMGWAGGHTVIIDRPEGRAGGMGLGFNGAQMLALALGGCFCNDLRYTAESMNVDLDVVEVTVTVTLEGEPLVTTAADMQVRCTRTDGGDASDIIESAKATCMVANSLQRGVAVNIHS